MRNRTYPKENQKKLNETIREMKALIRKQQKEINFLKEEIDNLVKPVRERKKQVERPEPGSDAWRQDFIKRFKRDVLGE